jgi:hypothetical protein
MPCRPRRVEADGVGLFRTEFLFMSRDTWPDEDEQFEAYRAVVKTMAGKPVTVRTLDVGADKELEGATRTEDNPALGLRAIRFCLAEPKMFLTQLRALLRASHYGKLKILIPMLASSHEIDQTLVLLDKAKAQLRERKIKFDEAVQVGGMIEVPAAALCLGAFTRQAAVPVHRHQRPDPVHAGHRPGQRGRRPPLQPAAPGRAAPDPPDHPGRHPRPAFRCRCAARWPATPNAPGC